jgi:hypothetical protein
MCFSVLQLNVAFFVDIRSPVWQAALGENRLVESSFLALKEAILLIDSLVPYKGGINASLQEWRSIFLLLLAIGLCNAKTHFLKHL